MSVIVIGGGASGLHAALTLLNRGAQVTLIDPGRPRANYPHDGTPFSALPEVLADPAGFFLGADFQAVHVPRPGGGREYYGLPPSKDFIFDGPPDVPYRPDGMAALRSFATGGLGEAWTAGAYAFDATDMADWPVSAAEMAPFYDQVAARIGIGGQADDLTPHMPLHAHLHDPIALDPASAALLARYETRRDRLARKVPGFRLGRSRQAALARGRDGRGGCTLCGRCLWGCPNGALYTPGLTLRDCMGHAGFTYLPGHLVRRFDYDGDGNITGLAVVPRKGGPLRSLAASTYVLACGTLETGRVVLESLRHGTGRTEALTGLMDNRQILAPFYTLAMFGRPQPVDAYQYHQLAMGLAPAADRPYVHGQITTFSSGDLHPVIQQMPLPLPMARTVMQAIRSGLGVVNLNFADTRRDGNVLTLDPGTGSADRPAVLSARYRPGAGEAPMRRAALAQVARGFRALGAPLVPGMTHIRPMGSSVHYAGTLPMSDTPGPLRVDRTGRSHDFGNLYVADGSVFPSLPAKNLTFTLMANATRIAAGIPLDGQDGGRLSSGPASGRFPRSGHGPNRA